MAKLAAYSPWQKALHWTTVAIVVLLIPMGFYMVRRYAATNFDATTQKIYDVHKSLGFLLLWLVIARLALRLSRGVPAPEASLAPWQRLASEATHRGLYLLLLVVPILGWAGASADGMRSLLGGFQLPEVLAKNDDLGWRILWWHGWAAISLGAFAGLHIAAALMHRFVHKDGVFQRMWPSRPQR